MSRTRILAIDHGNVRLGFAISDPERRIASPLTNYTRKTRALDLVYLKRLIEEQEAGLILIGLPLHNDGRESDQSQAARKFGAWLEKETTLPCRYYDERFTSLFAEQQLWNAGLTRKKRKDRRDKVAAQSFLQAYLDAGCPDNKEE